jgi:hypothetical protein
MARQQRHGLAVNERGMALPVAMLALLILSVLMIGFATLSASEPTIASNQLMVAQARALAEAGLERAIWALNNPNDPRGIPSPLGRSAPAPYDGSELVRVPVGGAVLGGFRVTVTGSASSAERVITAVGWVPDDNAAGRAAHQKITVTAVNPQQLFKDPPAALSARGELQVSGNAVVDSRADTSCGNKVGTITTAGTSLQGSAMEIRGAGDGNSTPNELTDAGRGPLPANAHDIVTNLATAAFDRFGFTDSDIDVLRAYAKAHGTYLRGTVDFGAGNRMTNGLIFVDTVGGTNITPEGVTPATPSSSFASVSIHRSAAADARGIFSGWLFVNGSLAISGDVTVHGMVYAQNDLSYHGTGAGRLQGAAISRHIRDLSSTSIDSDLLGHALVDYDCAHARTGGGTIPGTWSVRSGTYKELCDSCT